MATYEFGPGEEKLADAFELIVELQRNVLQLSARIDVDTMVLGSLLQAHTAPEAVLDAWNTMSSQYLPSVLLSQLSGSDLADASREAGHRADFWRNAIQTLTTGDR